MSYEEFKSHMKQYEKEKKTEEVLRKIPRWIKEWVNCDTACRCFYSHYGMPVYVGPCAYCKKKDHPE